MSRLSTVAVLVSVVAVAAVACGSGPAGGGAGATTTPTGRADGGGGGGGGGTGGRQPGVFGVIAAATPGTLQVQNSTSQTTVTYTDSTTFSQTVAATLAVGDCIMVAGSPAADSSTAITATFVRIETRTDGGCTFQAGPGGGQGAGAGGAGAGQPGGTPPSGGPLPSQPRRTGTPPSGAPGGDARGSTAAVGTVTTVSGSTVTIDGTIRGTGSQATTSASAPPGSTASIRITLGADAPVTRTVAATSAAAVVGQCAAAAGPADDTGAVAATAITISAPGPGCTRGFAGAPGRGGSGG